MMRNKGVVYQGEPSSPEKIDDKYAQALSRLNVSRKLVAGIILLVALVAFELFNFDTTRYALQNLLGDVSFAGLKWAAILAVAFCAIDFAGLTRLFTPEKGQKEPTAVWYLMGAWLIGATMNAVMTWWAISLTLLAHEFGNEVLSREQLLRWVPFFVAALVWLTRILFIGAFSVAGEYIFDVQRLRPSTPRTVKPKVTSPAPHPVHTRRPAMAARPAERSAPGKRPSAKHPPRPAPSQRRSPGLQTRGRSR